MKFKIMIAIAFAGSTAIAVNAMDAQTFYSKGIALQKQGASAMFSRDLQPLLAEIRRAGKSVKAENERAKASGKPLFCPPKDAAMEPEELLNEFGRIPKSQRMKLSVTQALRTIAIRRYPC